MKKISYEEYLSSNHDNYVDVENPADCSIRLKTDSVEIMVHKDVNRDDDPEHFFNGDDENVCIVYKDSEALIVYDCTWLEVLSIV